MSVPDPRTPAGSDVRLLALVSGAVQGVGFRWWTRCRARELGLVGHARNLPDGRVEVSAQGGRAPCERLLTLLREPVAAPAPSGRRSLPPRRPGRVDDVDHSWLPATERPDSFVER